NAPGRGRARGGQARLEHLGRARGDLGARASARGRRLPGPELRYTRSGVTGDALLQYLSDAVYIAIFLATGTRALRRPDRAAIDAALLFGVVAVIISQALATQALGIPPGGVSQVIASSLIMAMPYLLLRLVADHAGVPGWLMRIAEVGLGLSVLAFVLLPMNPLPLWATLACVTYYVGLELYAAVVFVREAGRASGVTRRRMQSVAVGSALLGLTIL